jgi:hypothetical protein
MEAVGTLVSEALCPKGVLKQRRCSYHTLCPENPTTEKSPYACLKESGLGSREGIEAQAPTVK